MIGSCLQSPQARTGRLATAKNDSRDVPGPVHRPEVEANRAEAVRAQAVIKKHNIGLARHRPVHEIVNAIDDFRLES
jgi:hypothetical protein